jgi:hypothetical protein
MTLISQLKNYWSKLFSKKYRIGERVEFTHKINNVHRTLSGVIEEINESSIFPYCIKLSDSFDYNGWQVSYINIDKNQIL